MVVRRWLLLLLLLPVVACAKDGQCARKADLGRLLGYPLDEAHCECGSPLHKITLTPPSGTHLVAYCYPGWQSGTEPMDLASGGVTFDDYTDGNYPGGEVYLMGDLVLHGTIVYAPNDSETEQLWFEPRWHLIKRGTPFDDELGRLFLDEDHLDAYHIGENQQSLLQGDVECIQTEAVLRIRGVDIRFDDHDASGAYPLEAKLVSINPGYVPCRKLDKGN